MTARPGFQLFGTVWYGRGPRGPSTCGPDALRLGHLRTKVLTGTACSGPRLTSMKLPGRGRRACPQPPPSECHYPNQSRRTLPPSLLPDPPRQRPRSSRSSPTCCVPSPARPSRSPRASQRRVTVPRVSRRAHGGPCNQRRGADVRCATDALHCVPSTARGMPLTYPAPCRACCDREVDCKGQAHRPEERRDARAHAPPSERGAA